MDIQLTPKPLSGAVTPPPSKSMAHRLLIAAALAGGVSTIRGLAPSQDIQATRRCLTALGAEMEDLPDGSLRVHGLGGKARTFPEPPVLDCGESGSTLRFLIPVALAVAGGAVFVGHGRLMERPLTPYFTLFDRMGISHEGRDNTLTVLGRLTPGEYPLPGNVSSQFFSGLLFALPLLDGPSVIRSTTTLESADYIAMTLDAMRAAEVTVAWEESGFQVAPGAYRPIEATVEADWSQAGFWYAAAFLDNAVTPAGLNPDSAQGDKVVSELYWKLAKPGEVEIDVSGCPDLLPPLAVMAARRSGTTRFVNAARLRIKESDRLTTTANLLNALGGKAEEGPDFLTVRGGPLTGGTVDSANDHRIAMAAAIAATNCAAPVTVLGAECVKKSYPDFWEVYQSLGGDVRVL